AWLYDEDRWPSGAAGGFVTQHKKYRRRSLVMLHLDTDQVDPDEDYRALFSAHVADRAVRDLKPLENVEAAKKEKKGRQILAFVVKIDDPSPWYNGYTYLDTLNDEAVQKFIEVTHEAYLREIGVDCGNVVPGIFTDEPNYGTMMRSVDLEGKPGFAIPWTRSLPDTFRSRYGYDIMDHLPEIFLDPDGEPISEVRWHYMDCITHMFTDAFARQIGDWCEDNDLMLTGHVLAEPTLDSQTRVVGSAMRFYEHMQAPGVDMLTEHRAEYGTVKQCSSVQQQMGRRWVLSETYGCTGWDFPFEGHKAVGDWQAALGVNLRCQHLSWYTMAGQAKRDYPASIHYQSPWWPLYEKVEDYFGRVNVLMSRGQAVRSILVVSPLESVWSLTGQDWENHGIVKKLDEQHQQLRQWLLKEHLDFDYGDEAMLDRWGEVMPGDEATMLRLCEAKYRTVVVPPVVTLRRTTVELLKQFAEEGGRVIFCGDPPSHIDALPAEDDRFEFLADCRTVPFERKAVIATIEEGARCVSIREEHGSEHPDVLYHLRRHDGRRYVFICNSNRQEKTGPVTVEVEGKGDVQYWNPENGERYLIDAGQRDGKVVFHTNLAPSGSRLFVVGASEPPLPAMPETKTEAREHIDTSDWTVQRNDPNVLVMDYISFRVNGGETRGPEEVLKADQMIRDELGFERRGGRMVQPWKRKSADSEAGAALELKSVFHVDSLPGGVLRLALEQPERYRVELNGHEIPIESECGWWVDRAIRLLPVDPALIHEGQNEIRLAGHYDSDAGLEAMFLLGDFAVEMRSRRPVIEKMPAPGFGDWTQQGLPFYTGSVAYRRMVDLGRASKSGRVHVELPDFRGVCARVLIDGEEAGVVAWPPYEVDITDVMRDRELVELTVEVVSHRRNAFGPLHNTETWPEWTGAAEFVTSGDQWQDKYNLVPCGCIKPPVIRHSR
ncbi:MAG: glycosyl hydrolase, partial [Planctomycetota bacterium]